MPVLEAFRKYFAMRQYRVVEIKATEIFDVLEKYVAPIEPLIKTRQRERYETYIAYGNQLREQFDDAILAATTIRRVMARRLRIQKGTDKFSRTVFLLHQFKRKEEIDLLRVVYGRLFFQVSTYSRRSARVEYLSRRFASSDHGASSQKYRPAAEELIQKDENEVGQRHGQRVASIFHDADFIANLDVSESIDHQVNRFCELIFGSNCFSPTKSEYGMFLARAAALRSLDLSRQVGAAIFSPSAEILALGSNEVPKAGGGTYWTDDQFDDRDYVRKEDSNFVRKREILMEILSIIAPDSDVERLSKDKRIQDSLLMDALEYGRVVHAEMGALSDAARLGHPVKDGVLYCTTFPCHICAKHIVAAGIAKVVFLEPYPKSLAPHLHSDSISVEGGDRGHYQKYPSVEFEHFYGVSPRRYREIFERFKRKSDDDGRLLEYKGGDPAPIIEIEYPSYAELETYITNRAMAEIRNVVADEEIAGA
ncbi:Deoxycytidylate deaminase [Bradyrhizobium sp. cf659]|nr:Deoxycytidylate deaminase [Bradyrhizobium sp. cf659]